MHFPPIAVLRHGETEWNRQNRMQGRFDSPLTALGLSQASQQRESVASFVTKDWAVLSSPQPRALHTAVLVFGGTQHLINTDPRLCEIDVGHWAGRLRDDIKADVERDVGPLTGGLDHYDKTPGEGFAALHARCFDLLSSLTGPTVLVTHGVTSRMLRLVAMGMETDAIADLPGGQGVVHLVKDGTHKTLGEASQAGPAAL